MLEIHPTKLIVVGCLAMACGGPESAPATQLAGPSVVEARAAFAPRPDKRATNHTAKASIKNVDKRARAIGSLRLVQRGDSVTLTGVFKNLPTGVHGIQIHTEGDCGGAGAARSGTDFNPTETRHGPPESSRRHVGDLGNIEVDRRGRAIFEMKTDSMTVVKDGPSSVLGRSVVITKNADDGRSQPDGNAGPAIACGVIR